MYIAKIKKVIFLAKKNAFTEHHVNNTVLVKVLQRNRICDIYIRACCHFSRVQILSTLWTITCQALLSMAFFRQEYWSVWLCPPPEGLLDPGIEATSLMSTVLAGGFFTTSAAWEALRWAESSPKIWNLLICNMAKGTQI